MAHKKISELTELVGSGVARTTDSMAIVDASAEETKLIYLDELGVACTNYGAYMYYEDGGTGDVRTATLSPAITAYTTGMRVTLMSSAANTGTTTLNLNSVGAKTIKKKGATNLSSGDIASGMIYEVVYDGTYFQLLTPVAN
jgi:hypothetical protein